GYKSENIVVLTPYLGQLHQLRDALKHDNDPILNDLDSSDLARAGISGSAPSELKAKKGRIHLATIDNYQGEESDIVVTSLTRSNKSNAIGFMHSPGRLNVLLSRARDGLILIGNSQTFLHSRKGGALWRQFFTLLEKGQYVYQGFPVKCQRHPDHVILLKRASDFDKHCPDGGCTEACGFTLACGHTCPMKCHPDRSSGLHNPHDRSQCKIEMNGKCPAGHHRISWECRLPRPSDCSTCAKEAKRLDEIARQKREAQKKREEAEAEHRRQVAELLQAERAVKEQRRLQEEREAREEAEAEHRRQLAELLQAKSAAEEQRRLQEEREAHARERLRRHEEDRKRQEERERQRLMEEREEEERKREEELEMEGLHQETLWRTKQRLVEEREAEIRREQALAEAERREPSSCTIQ
ncbi:hypothetical protein OG21DRAFT_1527705, partial [Imleria badia]